MPDQQPLEARSTLRRVACGWADGGSRIIVEWLQDRTGDRAYIRATRYVPAPAGRLVLSQQVDTFVGEEYRQAGPIFAEICRLIRAGRTEAHR